HCLDDGLCLSCDCCRLLAAATGQSARNFSPRVCGLAYRALRKGLTSYGDEAFSLFLRKAFIKAAGYSDDALDRPIVGIADTASDYNSCHGNAPALIEAAKRGVMLAGGLPMVFPTIS